MSDLSLWEPHIDPIIASFSEKKFAIINNFLSQSEIQSLLEYGREKEILGDLALAAIGKGVGKKKLSNVRSDKIYWIDSFEHEAERLAQQIFESLQLIVRKDFYMPAKRFECHIAKYDKGSFYARHSDRHALLPGRIVSCVIYLNECENESGNLVLYLDDNTAVSVKPEPGKVVIFDSRLDHEVLEAQSDRWSLTGWIREDLVPGLQI